MWMCTDISNGAEGVLGCMWSVSEEETAKEEKWDKQQEKAYHDG